MDPALYRRIRAHLLEAGDVHVRVGAPQELPELFAARPDQEVLANRGLQGAMEILNWLVGSLESEGFPILDGFDADSLDFAEGAGLQHNRERIEGLGKGINYLICLLRFGIGLNKPQASILIIIDV